MDEHEQRVRQQAYRLWQEEGRPEGRATAHWDMARELVAQAENQSSMTKPNPMGDRTTAPGTEPAEPPESVKNLGEFPNLTDQGDKPAYPVRAVASRRRKQGKR